VKWHEGEGKKKVGILDTLSGEETPRAFHAEKKSDRVDNGSQLSRLDHVFPWNAVS
jgi:hypothetical protein